MEGDKDAGRKLRGYERGMWGRQEEGGMVGGGGAQLTWPITANEVR